MAKVSADRILDAPPDDVWRTVGDPRHLARWWPKVQRVEDADGEAFTEVLQTDRGRPVRADWTITELVVGDEARMLAAAAAAEADAVDGGVRGAGQALQVPEGREPHARLPVHGAREGVLGLEDVVHGGSPVVIGRPDVL
jgi:hypothetical protein